MLLLLAACTSPESFTEDLATARCETYERCDVTGVLGYDDLDHCLELQAGLQVPACELDAGAARDCVSGWQDMECGSLADPPQACFEVCDAEAIDTNEG